MFIRFSNAMDRFQAIQQAVEAANNDDYFQMRRSHREAYPYVNVSTKDDNSFLTVELPGLKKEDITVEIKDDLFRISGERKIKYPENAKVHLQERRGLKFDRTIKLPMEVDLEKVKAEFANGVLQVVLPKAESAKPKLIKVA